MNSQSPIEPQTVFLALDQGGHASRAFIFNSIGDILSSSYQPIQTFYPGQYEVEHDPEEIINSINRAADEAITNLTQQPTTIVAAGLATQRSSIVCWDRYTGTPLSPVISWQDRRTTTWMQPFNAERDNIHRRSGLFPSPHYGASKLHWCLDNLPSVTQAAEQQRLAWGPLASFILFRLLDEHPHVIDPANASRTLLWNVSQRTWDQELLTLFNIPPKPLPHNVTSRYTFGQFTVNNTLIPMTVVTGDQSAALFNLGVPQKNTLYINIGTGAFIQKIKHSLPQHSKNLLRCIVHQDDNIIYYALEGTVNGAGSALTWFAETYKVDNWQEKASQWLAESLAPPLFLNGVGGVGSPYWQPQFNSCFLSEASIAEKFTAVVESIVFLIMDNINEINREDTTPDHLLLTGGGAKLDGLCQRLADLSTLAVLRPIETEATARGVAFLLAGMPKARPQPATGTPFLPMENTMLQKRYHHWQNAMQKAFCQKN